MSAFDNLDGLSPGGHARSAATRAVKDLVRKHFDLDGSANVFVAEIACAESDCPDTETVIAVFLDDTRREFRIYKPVAEITGADIVIACQPSVAGGGSA
jgi:hypothetical protein